MPTMIVDVSESAQESNEAKRMNATMSSRQTVLEAEFVKIRGARRTMRGRISVAEEQINLERRGWQGLNRHSRS